MGEVGAKDNNRFSKNRRLFTRIYNMINSTKFGVSVPLIFKRDVGANLGVGTVYVAHCTLRWNSNDVVPDTFYLWIDLFVSLGKNSHDQLQA